MREALGDDEEVPLPVLDGPERRLERAAALVNEVDHRGRVVLEEVVHRAAGAVTFIAAVALATMRAMPR